MTIQPLIKSPQERALESIIWDRLSSFWTETYDPSDRDALNAMYDAFLKALDSEYIRLFQIDDNKSLYTAPIYTQRRWVRVDLNRYETLKKWFRFLTGGDPYVTTGQGVLDEGVVTSTDGTTIPGGSNENTCGVAPTNHTKHWHISFPWRMTNDTSKSFADRQTLELSLPIYQSLTAIWRMGSDGTGVRLAPGIDYEIGSNGKSIRILEAAPSHRYEFQVAFDLSSSAFDGLSPVMVAPLGFAPPGTLVLPTGFGAGLPIHAIILRNPPPMSVSPTDGTAVSTATNTPFFTTERIFIPYAYGSDPGMAYKTKERIKLPDDVVLNANDIVLLFGLAQLNTTPSHAHVHATRVITTSAPVSSVELYEYQANQPVFGVVDLFANEFRVSANGRLLSPEAYQFDAATGRLVFATPITPTSNGTVRLDIEFTSETASSSDQADMAGHLHYVCDVTVADVPEVYDTFDDGGVFDDQLEQLGRFDSSTAVNSIVFDVLADLSTISVYLQGVLLEPGSDYAASVVGSGVSAQLRLFFAQPIKGKTVVMTYRAPALTVQVGGADLIRATGATAVGSAVASGSNRYGITQLVLDNLSANFVQVTTAFKSAYGVTDADMQRLIEAAYIASAGGNPVLTLFFDEFPEYNGLPIDANGLLLSAAQTRAVESADTDFVDIPYLQDHVLSPTIRLFAGTDYQVSRGEIAGSATLLASRGTDDAVPGRWWAPLLVLDEQFLSRNFGSLVGDVRESSQSYRDALAANFRLRFQGPTVGNMQRALCSYLGSRIFSSDARVAGYATLPAGKVVTVRGTAGEAQESFDMRADDQTPLIGNHVFPGQSLRGGVVYDKTVSGMIDYGHTTLSITDDVHLLRPGDTVRMQMRDPVYATIAWLTFTVSAVEPVTNTATQHYRVTFTRATSYIPFNGMLFRAYRDNGAPYSSIEGVVSAVDMTIRKFLVLSDGTQYEVNKDAPEVFVAGQIVYRGDPVDPTIASVYDHESRPDWYRYSAANFRSSLNGTIALDEGIIGSGYATITPNGADYALVALSPVPPPLVRGTRLVVVLDGDASTHVLLVSGPATNPGEYWAQSDLTGSQAATASVTILRPARQNAAFVEFATGTGYMPTVAVSVKAILGAHVLSTTDTAEFPAKGRCQVTLLDGPGGTPGSTVEFSYDGKTTNELRSVQWGSAAPVESEVFTSTATILDPGCVITLIGRFADDMLNPAFAALVKLRASREGSTTSVVVSPTNAPTLYELLKQSSTVVETALMTKPEPLLSLIREATPVGSTTVLFSKHIISDALDLAPTDGLLEFQAPSLAITVADPTTLPVESGNVPTIWLPPNQMSLGLGSVLDLGSLTPPPGKLQGPFTYTWTVTEEVNVERPAVYSDPTQETLRIDLQDTASILYVKLVVIDSVTKTARSHAVRVRRFNIPVIVVEITSPTTGTKYPNSDWTIPAPVVSMDLKAVVDPAAPPTVLGPYTYAWTVIDENPNPAPIVTGGTTPTPNVMNIAANAVLKVTLVVTATGIPSGMTNTFTKVVHITLT